MQLYEVAPHPMYVCYVPCVWVGPEPYLEKNFLSLILMIPLAKFTNQNKGICRHRILYPVRLEPLFPSDAEILKPKVGLRPN